ncbi:MAG TPA: hypothetical protein VF599_21175 [Pyrinomonadaceae bacterium]|jgi:serine/threonine-protein kinase
MKNDDWQKIESVFHKALNLSAEERHSYIFQACLGDEALASEVASLITAFEQKQSRFLEQPAFSLGLGVLEQENLAEQDLTGRKIGCYEVKQKLGSGGMGDVYLAEDTRLNRQVALKFLKNSLINDKWAERLLVREARAVAMLEQPLNFHHYANLSGLL